jgi:hypothetical protein
MNRNDEYLKLMDELEATPIQLEDAQQRVKERLKSEHRRRIFIMPLTSLVSAFIMFVVLVNCFPTFAYACGKIPLVKELVQLVAFSPSLLEAVENEYVQPIEEEQTINGITARIEYVIVDQKQLNIFYSLDSDIYTAMRASAEIKASDGSSLEGYSISSSYFGTANKELNYVTVDFMEQDMPGSMLLTLKVWDTGNSSKESATVPVEDAMVSDKKYEEPEYVSEFTFALAFDPYFTAQDENIVLGETFEIDGQTLILDNMEIYPTHIRIDFSDIPTNTVWLKDLSFYMVNESNKRFEPISGGITATGSVDSPMMKSHRLESSFFSNSEELTLYITGVDWLDKDMEKIKIDLANVTAENLPQGVTFENAKRRGDTWILTFVEHDGKVSEIWSSNYYDEYGKEYHINSWSTGVTGDSQRTSTVTIPLVNYPYDTVYMSPLYTRKVELTNPIVIKIK